MNWAHKIKLLPNNVHAILFKSGRLSGGLILAHWKGQYGAPKA